MNLWLYAYLERNRITIKNFFESAYIHKFQKRVDLWQDIEKFKNHDIIPAYVAEYVKDLQGSE